MGIPTEALTPLGLLGGVFLMVMWGWLIPRWVVTEIRRERDDWRNVANAALEQNTQLVLSARALTGGPVEGIPTKEATRT